MIDRATDASYLQYQYGDSEKLRIRYEAHARYSEHPSNWHALFTDVLGIGQGTRTIDVGCGHGSIHPTFSRAGGTVVGIDSSGGMVAEARAQATRDGLSVSVVHGDAQHLPFPDDQFDVAFCSHMLYHVPDIRAALREMRRVVRTGGRVIITTNAGDHSARLNALHTLACRELGYAPLSNAPERRFSLAYQPLVRSVFPDVELHLLPNAFLFPDADAALRYYASGRIDSIERTADQTDHRAPLLARMRELIDEIINQEGVFRVPKDAGYFLATVP